MLSLIFAVGVLALPIVMTSLHAAFVWNSLRSQLLYLVVSVPVQYVLLFTAFYFTVGHLLLNVGIAGGAPAPGSESERIQTTLLWQTCFFVVVYLITGWLAQWALGRGLRKRSDEGTAA